MTELHRAIIEQLFEQFKLILKAILSGPNPAGLESCERDHRRYQCGGFARVYNSNRAVQRRSPDWEVVSSGNTCRRQHVGSGMEYASQRHPVQSRFPSVVDRLLRWEGEVPERISGPDLVGNSVRD